jgi:hypothetical protein
MKDRTKRLAKMLEYSGFPKPNRIREPHDDVLGIINYAEDIEVTCDPVGEQFRVIHGKKRYPLRRGVHPLIADLRKVFAKAKGGAA